MAKGSNNLRGRTSDASKPYNVSNSFVKRVASRVTELLPQPTSWFSRWMSPSAIPNASDFSGHPLSRPPATSRAELNLVDDVDHVPAKRPRTNRFSSPIKQNKFIRSNTYTAEDISPIAVRGEPVAGPSTAHTDFIASTPATSAPAPVPRHIQPQNTTKVNGDDCSETSESTSGCSSLVPQAQSTTHSLGGSRYGRPLPSVSNVETLRRRGPSFSNATFTAPLRTSMRERLGSSPFYSGRTMYGGASQAYVSVMHPSQKRVVPTVRPITSQQSLPLSSTAKRILDALEQFSTPVMDAKRIPVAVGSKRKMESSSYQRYSELTVPSTADLLRVKRRERLQQSTSAARQTATTSRPPPSPEYTIRNEDSDKKKFTGKVKRKENVEDDVFVEVKLPAAVLPVDKLPKIDIAIPPPSTTQSAVLSQLSTSTSTSTHSSKFSFANPTVVPRSGSVEALPSSLQTSSFKFSFPIVEQTCKGSVSDNTLTVNSSVYSLSRTSSDRSSTNQKRRSSKDENRVSDKVVGKLYNSVETPLSMSTPKNAKTLDFKHCETKNDNSNTSITSCQQSPKTTQTTSGSSDWECLSCQSKNLPGTQSCKCCQTQKSKQHDTSKNDIKSATPVGFGNLYKKPVGTWECSVCMIQNNKDDLKCIACEAPKPVKKEKVSITPIPSISTTSGFGDKFKKPSGSWECQSCLIQNKSDSSKCVACETPKLGAKPNPAPKANISFDSKLPVNNFGDKFKAPAGSWSCEVCMINNEAAKSKCVACESPKPGVDLTKVSEQSASQFSFGIPASTTPGNSSAGFSFGINKNDQANLATSKNLILPKSNVDNSTTPSFTFGIPVAKTDQVSSSTNVTTTTSSNPIFQFGSSSSDVKLPAPSSTQENTKPSNKSASMFLFGNAVPEKNDFSLAEVNKSSTIDPALGSESKKNSDLGNKNEKLASGLGNIAASNPLFTFGTNKINTSITQNTDSPPAKVSKGGFAFGTKQGNYGSNIVSSTTSTISTSSSSNVFKFGETKSVPSGGQMTSISSINSQQSLATNKPNNMFNIGAGSEKKEINFGLKAPQESTKVINTSTPSLTLENKPAFTAFNATTSQPTAFGNTTTTFGSSTFGNKETPNPFTPQTTSNVFGTTETTNSSSASTFPGFGQTIDFSPVIQECKQMFSFGSSSNEQPSSGGLFSKPAPEKKQQENIFAFSANQPNPPAVFGFGSNASSAPSTTFNFEPKLFAPTAVQFNNSNPVTLFGSSNVQQTAVPAFGEQPAPSNPIFAFGSQPAQQPETPANTVFSFTSTQQSSSVVAPAPSQGGFMFGQAPAPAPPTGSAPAPAAATPSFDPNIKPTFNFSQGSTPVFSAVNPSGAPVVRKFRKAVRRTNISSNRQP